MWLAAAILSGIAAGEARAQAKFDPLCSTRTRSLDERIAICTRLIDRTLWLTRPFRMWPMPRYNAPLGESGEGGLLSGHQQFQGRDQLHLEIQGAGRPEAELGFHVTAAYVQLHCAGDFDAALAVLERATRLKPSEPAEAFAARALVFSEKRDFRSAYAEIVKAQPLDLRQRPPLLRAGGTRGGNRRDGHPDEGIKDFDEVIRLKPGYAAAYSERGNIWRMKGDLSRALTDLNIAVRLDPDDAGHARTAR